MTTALADRVPLGELADKVASALADRVPPGELGVRAEANHECRPLFSPSGTREFSLAELQADRRAGRDSPATLGGRGRKVHGATRERRDLWIRVAARARTQGAGRARRDK